MILDLILGIGLGIIFILVIYIACEVTYIVEYIENILHTVDRISCDMEKGGDK